MTERPPLDLLEQLVAQREYARALQLALGILQAIDRHRGRLDDVVPIGPSYGGGEAEVAVVFATRFAAALGRLLTEPQLEVSAADYEVLLSHHRWIALVFSLSGFRTSDSFLSLIAKDAGNGSLNFEAGNFLRLLALLSMDSWINVNFEDFWRGNPVASCLAFLNYISSRYVFSQRAFELRERLLEWIPARLNDVKLGNLTLERLPEVYMHCSYALTPSKHAIKRPLMGRKGRGRVEKFPLDDQRNGVGKAQERAENG